MCFVDLALIGGNEAKEEERIRPVFVLMTPRQRKEVDLLAMLLLVPLLLHKKKSISEIATFIVRLHAQGGTLGEEEEGIINK